MPFSRILVWILSRILFMGGVLPGLFLMTDGALDLTRIGGHGVLAQDLDAELEHSSDPVVPGEFHGDLRDLPEPDSSPFVARPRFTEPPQDPDPYSKLWQWPVSQIDPLLERLESQLSALRSFKPPDLNIKGIPFQNTFPPDTVGEIGSDHYIQMTNSPQSSAVKIFDKNGTSLAGPFALDSLWNSGGACATGNGDPIVLYDHLAARWLMSEFAATGNHLCVYISMTDDPIAGGWFNYDFATPNFPDYPKYAVWPDAYYVSTNEPGSPAAYALDRTNMVAGLAAAPPVRRAAPVLAGFAFNALIPSDLDGPAPPAGSPNFFMRHRDDEAHNAGSNDPNNDFLEIWEFSADFAKPGNSTLVNTANVPVAEFDSDLCGLVSFECFPQPGTAATLDPLREVIMWRLQYRNFGTHETLVGNFATDVNGADRGGIRWFELRRTPPGAGAWKLFQEGTHSPDAKNRWMGSIAMDRAGNIALGYSLSSTTTFPSIAYTGRLSGDGLGKMPLGEVFVRKGQFSQSSTTRWGDYSSMNLDPVDGCTFWYTNEFVNNFQGEWATRIASFKMDSCGGDAVAGDFDGDKDADIFWRHGGDGRNKLWRMDGLTREAVGNVPKFGNTDWAVAGLGDFTGDGLTDVLWRNGVTGANKLWEMSGSTRVSSKKLPNLANTDWVVAGVGDFFDNALADIFWHNEVTGANKIWRMNGAKRVAQSSIPKFTNINWQPVGVGDFNDNGKADILWRQLNTGANKIWPMNGFKRVANAAIPAFKNTDWGVAGLGDFDKDAKIDILWRNGVTGANKIWLMNGTSRKAGSAIPKLANTDWAVVGTGDYDASKEADILWRNGVSGANRVWLMQGFTRADQSNIPKFADTQWQVQR